MKRHRRIATAQRAGSVAVAVVALLLAWVTPAQAERFPSHPAGWGHPGHHDRGWPHAPVGLQVTTNVAEDCDGVLLVAFDLWTSDPTRPDGKAYRPDDGRGRLQVHEVSGRSGPGGQWLDTAAISVSLGIPPPTSAGESRIRWDGLRAAQGDGLHIYEARVAHDGATPHSAVITDGCPS